MIQMEHMHYTTPVDTYMGPNSSRMTGELLRDMQVKKAVIVCDKTLCEAGLIHKISESLQSAGIASVIYDGVLPEPPDTMADEAAALCRGSGCEAVVAVGGGSCLDTGKCVAMLQRNEGSIRSYLTNPSAPRHRGIPLIAVPTTAGTGSEITCGAVLTHTGTGQKMGLGGKDLFASVVLIDPMLTLGLPKPVTAATAMDTFAHAVEGLLSATTNSNCMLFELRAIHLIAHNIMRVMENGSDVQARQNMMLAAYLAGMALNDASCNFGHSLAHVMGSRYHIPHGVACAAATPMTITYFADRFPDRIRAIGAQIGLTSLEEEDAQTAAAAVAGKIREMNRRLGLKTLQEIGVLEADLPEIARLAMLEKTTDRLQQAVPERKLTEQDYLAPLKREFCI